MYEWLLIFTTVVQTMAHKFRPEILGLKSRPFRKVVAYFKWVSELFSTGPQLSFALNLAAMYICIVYIILPVFMYALLLNVAVRL